MNRFMITAAAWTVAMSAQAREIVPAPIQTPWDAAAAVAVPFPEYPRPQMVRDEWQNLNGRWDYAVTSKGAEKPAAWEGKILVPFCFESELSGVNRNITGREWMWYRRTFEFSKAWKNRRIRLNFQASDWETMVYVNGREVGTHQGGYTPFAFDITDALKPAGPQELVVRVWDHQGKEAFVSAGKQHQAEVYEPCSGIWQTVWLEPCAAGAATSLKISGSLKKAAVELTVAAGDGVQAKVRILDGKTVVAGQSGAANRLMTIAVPNPKAWGPDDPFLYDLQISLIKHGKTIDAVKSYCGLRDIWVDKAQKGPQIVLNGQAFFHFGPLDQGYWPLSGLTPPTEEAQLFDLQYLKDIGCNMVRLHIKRNPSRWYYHCDRLGLLVWQDFICNKQGKKFSGIPGELERWKNEQVMLMDSLSSHPAVVKWIVFNESWGQQDTENVVKWAKGLLPNHIVSCASGWTDVDNLGDIRDIHDYSRFPSTTMPQKELKRAVVLGETGGFGVPVNGNNWLEMPEPRDPGTPDGRVPFGSRKGGMTPVNACADHDVINDIKRPVYSLQGLAAQYARYIETLHLEQAFDLSGAVYTQLTDMRHEQNGWLTFDRKVSKIPVEQMRKIHATLYRPVPGRSPLVRRGSQWKSSDGKTVVLPFTPKNPSARAAPAKGGKKKKKGKKVAGPMARQTVTTTYQTEFEVKQPPRRAALNIFMDSDHDSDVWNYLRIYLDRELIFDDMSRYKKPEYRVTCVPLTDGQCAKLTQGKHELSFELENRILIKSLDISLDAVEGERPWKPAVSIKRKPAAPATGLIWSYTMARPAAGWQKPGFDDSGWKTGPGGFGSRRKALKSMRTVTNWDTSDIWLRRTLELDKLPSHPALRIFHDEDAEVYLNGKLARTFKSFSKNYITVPIDGKHLKTGPNLLAIHCRQTRGGQFIDAAVVDRKTAPKATVQTVPGRWPAEKANKWYDRLPWLVGCNYYPATAINAIDMWQASTWDPQQIDKELGWAEGIGMNTLRVYLHDLVWADDEQGLYQRMDEFLTICQKHGIRPFFVFFDDCHYPNPKLGQQPLPVRAWHNSGWVNCPARAVALRYAEGKATPAEVAQLKGYVQQTMRRFANDERVLFWELYNEPGRGWGKKIGDKSSKLVHDSWVWAREVNPSQPVSSCTAGCVGVKNKAINRANSDIHSIHNYGPPAKLEALILDYKQDGRPVIVTEWLARTAGSTVKDCLPVMKRLHVGAVNWGFVVGKTQTHYPWKSRVGDIDEKRAAGEVVKPGEPFPEPELWFHDLFRMDGTPFDQAEIDIFRKLTGKN